MSSFTLLVGRIGLALIFILSGIGKITAYAATAKLLVAGGLPGGLLPFLICVELGGGLLIVSGAFTRWAAVVLCLYTLIVAVHFHGSVAATGEWDHFMQNIAIAGGFLVLAAAGPGGLSIDAWRGRRKQRKLFF
ncbi:MAG TPA: DoxX family protein [Rhodanobacteraceae bacterium]